MLLLRHWILLAHLGDQQGSHASTSATTQGVAQLESSELSAVMGCLPLRVGKEMAGFEANLE